MPASARPWTLLALGVALAGCGGSVAHAQELCADHAGIENTDEPRAELGTGAVTFEELADGDEVPIVWGAQGGVHVWGSVRVEGIYPGPRGADTDETSPRVDFLVEFASRPINFETGGPRNFRIRTDGTVEIVGEPVVLVSPTTSVDREVTFSVRVADYCGSEVHDAREVTIIDPED